MERLFHAVAFDVDGYGLSSILKAMFVHLSEQSLYDEKSGTNNVTAALSRERDDYFPNFGGFLTWISYSLDRVLIEIERLFGETYIGHVLSYLGDVACFVGAPIVLVSQQFFTTADVRVHGSDQQNHTIAPKLYTSRSSSASYNRTLRRELHKWSLHAIADFL
eukprot:jgi/Psemu1/303186/fgenesh1_kg.95_\